MVVLLDNKKTTSGLPVQPDKWQANRTWLRSALSEQHRDKTEINSSTPKLILSYSFVPTIRKVTNTESTHEITCPRENGQAGANPNPQPQD